MAPAASKALINLVISSPANALVRAASSPPASFRLNAAAGLYSQFDVQRGLPIRTLLKYFQKEEDSWRLNETIRSKVEFKTWNLLDDLFPLGRFDVALCRNVLPYFDMQTKFGTLQKLSRSMTDDGVLYVGLNEPLSGVSTSFQPVDAKRGIYTAHRPDVAKVHSLAVENRL